VKHRSYEKRCTWCGRYLRRDLTAEWDPADECDDPKGPECKATAWHYRRGIADAHELVLEISIPFLYRSDTCRYFYIQHLDRTITALPEKPE
jgi:hypothetical protein